MIDTLSLVKDFTEAVGPSGFEEPVREIIKQTWEPLVDELRVDRLGSLVAVKEGKGDGPRPRLMLAAHMDEIGLMVKQLTRFPDQEGGYGFIRVTPVGGVDNRHLFGQTVIVHGTGENVRDLVGIIGALPAHMLTETGGKGLSGFDDFVVDVGLPDEELRRHVAVGDFISFRQPLRELLNRRVTAKALDNRASVAAVTICLDYLQTRDHQWDVVAVATAQEETALLGAFTSAFSQRPDVAIAIDVNFGKGPGTSDDGSYELGSGPTVAMGPFHHGIFRELEATAKSLEMKINPDPSTTTGGTDAFGLQIAREGVPTGLVGIPLRYMHTMVESADLADVERAGRLLGEFAIRLGSDFLSRLAEEMMD